MKEQWKIINSYPDYQVSTSGRVNSMKHINCKILKQFKNKGGYYHIGLCENGMRKNIDVHRLVAQTFIPNIDNKPQVNHIDGNKLNNRVDNLEWVTKSENEKHAFKTGLKTQQGISNSNSKLTENEVIIIHGLYLGGMKQSEIAVLFKLTKDNIHKIIHGKTWMCLLA